MNIFVLDIDPKLCAKYHANIHVTKMLVETAQLLCSTYYTTEQSNLSPYKLTHVNHPCSIWTRESLSNWKWLKRLGIELYNEYKHRYGDKTHKSGEVIMNLVEPNLLDIGLTEFAQAMDDEFRNDDAVKAYRDYYRLKKSKLLNYKNRELPFWI